VYAAIDIGAPVAAVWDALTDYDGLGNFIPGTTLPPLSFTSLSLRLQACYERANPQFLQGCFYPE